ncbi:MAG TPA: squalene synthase HpnC [Acidimicrobiales bacterium]|nr:squalene synthase HpnC [Acidimicrobiales bacterium]
MSTHAHDGALSGAERSETAGGGGAKGADGGPGKGGSGEGGSEQALLGLDAVLSQAGAENFPVASRLLPARSRRHLVALYGFARLADDIGDEAEGDRLELLDWLERELDRAAGGTANHPLLRRLTPSIVELDLPLEPFRALIEANRRDQVVHRYQTFDDLLAYCMLSAAPVGQLVLLVLGESSPWRVGLSDDVCTGLQLVEHLQDVAEDLGRDRVYLPLDDLDRLGCDLADLSAPEAGPALRRLVALECGRARRLLGSGGVLAGTLPLRPRAAVAGFTAGGIAALDSIERAGFDVLGHRCRPRPLRFGLRFLTTLAGTAIRRPDPAGGTR